MYSRTQVISYIETWIYENTGNDITGSIMQAVLSYMADREYQPSEIPVSKEGYTATDLDAILTEIIANIEGVSAMTPAEIVAALETLSGSDSLSGAKVDYDGVNTVTGKVAELFTRLSIAWDSETNYGLGHLVYNDGAIYISVSASNTNHEPPNASYWTLIVTATQVKDLLETLTTTNRLNKSAILGADFALNYKGNRDLGQQAAMDIEFPAVIKGDFWIAEGMGGVLEGVTNGDLLIALVDDAVFSDGYDTVSDWLIVEGNNHSQLLTRRDIYDPAGESTTFTIADIEMNILQMSINRVPYLGIEGSSYSGRDFKFSHVAGDTVITLSPDLALSFANNDILDFLYTL